MWICTGTVEDLCSSAPEKEVIHTGAGVSRENLASGLFLSAVGLQRCHFCPLDVLEIALSSFRPSSLPSIPSVEIWGLAHCEYSIIISSLLSFWSLFLSSLPFRLQTLKPDFLFKSQICQY